MSLPAHWNCIYCLQVLVTLLLEDIRMESTCRFIAHCNFQGTRVEVMLSFLLCSIAVFSQSVNVCQISKVNFLHGFAKLFTKFSVKSLFLVAPWCLAS